MTEENAKNPSIEELYQAIISEYEKTKSIAKIAKKLGTTQVKVQRVLITEGLWTSKRTGQIAALRNQGMSLEQIAEELGVDIKTVQTFLPYTRGQYGQSDTDDAARSKDYRERMHSAAGKMKYKADMTMSDIKVPPNMEEELAKAKIGIEATTNDRDSIDGEKNWMMQGNYYKISPVFKLRFELVDHFVYGAGQYFEGKQRDEFHKLAKAENGIIREVLVPGSMNLHGLHYMIQRLFGWQNSHLHNFCVSKEEFDELTGGTIDGWLRLCGSLFHFSDDELSDRYWDEDYEETESVKSWLKRKYTGPYGYKCVSDTYLDTKREIKEFKDFLKQFGNLESLDELNTKVIMEESFNFLNERLSLIELLKGNISSESDRKKEIKQWRDEIDRQLKDIDEDFSHWTVTEREELMRAAKDLKQWRQTKDAVEQRIYYKTASDIRRETGKTAKQWLKEAKEMIPLCERKCAPLLEDYIPELQPLFNQLYYEYDYGDGWCVKITLLDQYDRLVSAEIIDTFDREKIRKCKFFCDGEVVSDELNEKLCLVADGEKPLCIMTDGLGVLDDVGGLGGFKDMLETLAGSDPDSKASMREWARGLGWTGRLSKAENML